MSDLYGSRKLTNAERAVAKLIGHGLTDEEIAHVVGTTDGCVGNHLRRIFDKTGVSNRVELALWWIAHEEEHAHNI